MHTQLCLQNLISQTKPQTLKKHILSLTEDQADELLHDFRLWARPEQLSPENYAYWLILAGRGWGKTRTGAEWVKMRIKQGFRYVNLVGATVDAARDIMIEGESGILACCSNKERPRYKKTERCLVWPNGAKSLIFTADEPDSLRGKQHDSVWADELAAWRRPETWAQIKFGLRLGKSPMACITTTPRPTEIIKKIYKDSVTFVTKGTTYDNKKNLAPGFFKEIITEYEGTRLGRQELNAEILDDNPNSLFKQSDIEKYRVKKLPDNIVRTIVAIDPAVSSDKKSDETGIIVAAISKDKEAYVIEDGSGIYTPVEWARKAIELYDKYECSAIVAETNQGGDLVESNLRAASDRFFRFIKVHASKGKAVRAEPTSGLYEKGKVHHVGMFPKLEDQMCDFDPLVEKQSKSPDRMDALVWAMFCLFKLDKKKTTGILEHYKNEYEKMKSNDLI